MSSFQIFLVALSCAVMALLGGVWVFQSYGVYRFSPTPQSPEAFGMAKVKVVNFTSEDGAPAQAWLSLPAPGRPILFSFYGNFSAIGPSLQRLLPLTEDGTGMVMLQYRGAGGLPGHPSEEHFARDARALYDQLDALAGQVILPDHRVLHGFSLGSAVAIRLATERAVAAVVLEAAFPQLCLYFQRRYHSFPLCHLMWAERHDSIGRIGSITAPKLFVHGIKDEDVPLLWGQQLFAAASGSKRFVVLPGGGHADLAKHGLVGVVQDFLRNRVD